MHAGAHATLINESWKGNAKSLTSNPLSFTSNHYVAQQLQTLSSDVPAT